jgi:hypothetical protein
VSIRNLNVRFPTMLSVFKLTTKVVGSPISSARARWLSRSGFQVAVSDHTGIDIIAYNPRTKQKTRNNCEIQNAKSREREGVCLSS